jgi:dUTP pyrophosphatase
MIAARLQEAPSNYFKQTGGVRREDSATELVLRSAQPLLAQLVVMLKVKKLSPDAVLPTVAHPGEDIGYDLYSCEDLTIAAHGAAGVHTGIAGGVVKTRSGLAKKRLLCNAGVIDAGYRGEIVVLMENLGDGPYAIRKGDKIAQLLEHPFLAHEVVEDELSNAARGDKGFGSSGS